MGVYSSELPPSRPRSPAPGKRFTYESAAIGTGRERERASGPRYTRVNWERLKGQTGGVSLERVLMRGIVASPRARADARKRERRRPAQSARRTLKVR